MLLWFRCKYFTQVKQHDGVRTSNSFAHGEYYYCSMESSYRLRVSIMLSTWYFALFYILLHFSFLFSNAFRLSPDEVFPGQVSLLALYGSTIL
jgi:hypothetical protein